MDTLTSTLVRLARIEALTLQENVHSKVNERAYEIFVGRGAGDGQALNDWLDAEREFIAPCIVQPGVAGSNMTVEVTLPEEDFPNLALYLGQTQLVVASDPAEDGRCILQSIDLPAAISMDGLDAEQSGRMLRITAVLSDQLSGKLVGIVGKHRIHAQR